MAPIPINIITFIDYTENYEMIDSGNFCYKFKF
jgi:hypothetical protein